MRRLRFLITGGTLTLLGLLGVVGMPLVALLYDPRYVMAGAVVVVIACVQIPAVIGMTYDQAALAAGDSKTFFWLIALRALVQTLAFLAGIELGGLWGALLAQGLALLVMHPAIVYLARKHKAWDALHDAVFLTLGGVIVALALWVNAATLGL